ETPLFSKGRLLYPWVQAKEALGKNRQALVCEGYMDAIACHQAGLEQAVASLGTALTEEHAKLLKRYVDRVLLVFDADAAGLRAARRAGEPLLGAGLDVRVARLKGAKDPDELLRRDGPEALRGALDEAQPLIDFCVQVGLAAAGAKPSPAQRAAALADVFPLLLRLPSASELDAALKAAAQAVGVSDEAALADLAAFKRGEQRNAPAALPAKAAGEPAALPAAQSLVLVEREILNLLVVHPPLVAQAKLDLGEDPRMAAPDLQAAAELLWRAPGGVVMALPDDGSESYKLGDALLSRLSHGSLPQLAPPEESLHDLILRRQELLLEHEVAVRTLALRQAEGDPAAEAELLKQMQAFKQAIQGLRRERRERPLARPEEKA
ncbi:MAG TPA: toprim domain-containing protein, partial [bacterium]|nr:toprim domain-containing protein [bacterium]